MCAAQTKKESETLGGVMVAAVLNVVIGAVAAFCVLAGTAPVAYSPVPKKTDGPPPPLPAGIWYWPGGSGEGDWESKEAAFLAAQPGKLELGDGDFNAWALSTFKAAPKAPAAAPAGPDGKPAPASSPPSFQALPGVPNFRSYGSGNAADGYFQVAMPFNVTVLGFNLSVLYQVRGTFAAGAQGPKFEPFYTSLGSARLPAMGGLAGMLFNKLAAEFLPADAVKKYAGPWAQYQSATPGNAVLVLDRQ